MKKAIVTLVVIGAIAGCGYGAYRTGYLQKYAGKYLGKVIPALGTTEETEGEGRVSSTDPNAVPLDSVSVIAGLGSGDGLTERFAGVVEPQETKKYTVDSERTVSKTYVKEGDEVKKGDKLFTYDVDSMMDKLEEAKIDLERLQNEVDVSEAKQQTLQKQLETASTPEKKLQALEEQNTYKQQKLELKSKQSKIDSIQEQIDNSTVTSDIDGVVKSINQNAISGSSDSMDYGDMSGDSSAYITLLKVGTYRIKGTVNEQNIGSGSIIEGEPMLVYSRVDPSVYWTGSISKIKTDDPSSSDSDDSSSDNSSTSSNYTFYVELESSDGLMLGQHVYLEKDNGQAGKKDGIWLPDYYIQSDEDGSSYVWAASDDNTLEKRKVELGDKDEEEQETRIDDGLHADDYICAPNNGIDLKEGLPVSYNDTSDDESLDLDEYTFDETELPSLEDLSGDSGQIAGSPMLGGSDFSMSDLGFDETESLDGASLGEEDLVPIEIADEDDSAGSDSSADMDDSGY